MSAAFTFEAYRQVLRNFREHGYRVRPPIDEPDRGERVLYLRHDVDYTLEEALNLARVNAEEGVAGCFYLPVASPFINLREERNRICIDGIREAGQVLGLHFYLPEALADCEHVSFDEVRALVLEEFELLETLVGGDAHPAMSWHNPGVLGESYSSWIQADIPGLCNAYALARKGVGYRADSNLRYTVEEWMAFATTENHRLQVLVHPFQWSIGAQRMEDILFEMFRRHIARYDDLLALNDVYGRRMPGGLSAEQVKGLFARLLETGTRDGNRS